MCARSHITISININNIKKCVGLIYDIGFLHGYIYRAFVYHFSFSKLIIEKINNKSATVLRQLTYI